MHDSLQEALTTLEALRTAVDGSETRPSAEEICVELTHVMALIVEHQQANTLPPTPKITDLEAAMARGEVVTIEPDGTAHAAREPEPEQDTVAVPTLVPDDDDRPAAEVVDES